ncbi:ATP-binding cassette domain-containing protein [Lentibacillus cibarius]|uniref:ATP-binding cassette domain-containing protein n=1 Tax=Lentibacillus cibarius TaxID=2583219 RepID=A0A5S3R6Z3_9BACI|nr:ATP-binding cassette domain-containing protein [Lentibacillus cibarius]TMN21143.1 ATP-binding cassette domain-containing protein [Lentibacillus cibarius]
MLNINIEKELAHYKLSLSFQAADEIIVLFGPSGSGKTTVLNCIAGLTDPDKGYIQLNHRILFAERDKPLPIQKRHIGYLFQDYALFPHKTVWKNIAYGMQNEQLALDLMRELRIEHLQNHYPQQISGGEKQRVALARALATAPDLLLLDEPFSALDDDTRKRSHAELLRLHRIWKIPVILVTHSREEAEKLGDRILYMEDGTLKRTEPHS